MRNLIFFLACFSTALLSACLLSACATAPKAKNIAYSCDRGTQFTVTYIKKGFTTMRGGKNSFHRYEERNVAADVTLADGTNMTLPAQKVNSGFMFSNGRYTLSGDGNKASWAVGKMLSESCYTNP